MSRRDGSRRGRTGGGAPDAFSPADIASLQAWYRETYAAGTWSDLSGSGPNLTQGTSGNRPAQVSRAGQLALSFDGGDWVQGTFGALKSQPLTIYAVCEPTSLASTQYVFDGDDATNHVAVFTNATPNWGCLATTGRLGGTPTLAIHAACFVANGASSGLYVDDFRSGQSLIAASPGTAGLDALIVGARYLTDANWNGYIWELIVYSGAHNAATRKLIGDYFTARYSGLTVTT